MIKKASIGILIGIMGLSACSTSSGVKGSAVTQAKNAPSDLANAPAKAQNLKNVKIPDYLKNANDPYARTYSTSCADIRSEVAQLDEFLGPDWDSPNHYSKVGGKRGNLFDAVLPYGDLFVLPLVQVSMKKRFFKRLITRVFAAPTLRP